MISRRPVPALLAALGILLTTPAHAGPPSAANSFVDECIRVCPGGDMNFHVVVRDLANVPVAGSSVVINFGSCQSVILCPPLPTDPYTFVPPNSIRMLTNAAGIADFPIRAGGVCRDSSLLVFADGVLLANRTSVVSPDQNGDLTVNAVDNGILAGKLGSFDPTGDLNCGSGFVEAGDTGILLAHAGHSCQAVVPNNPKSWGSVKVIYR